MIGHRSSSIDHRSSIIGARRRRGIDAEKVDVDADADAEGSTPTPDSGVAQGLLRATPS
jgi:hypothetical protein